MKWSECRDIAFDAVIVTCGYETRAQYLLTELVGSPSCIVALDYGCAGQLNYDANREEMMRRGASFISIDSGNFAGKACSTIAASMDSEKPASERHILVDVSSCSRSVLAEMLLALAREFEGEGKIYCAYALSAFDRAPESEMPSNVSEPVIGELAGWSEDLSKPPCAIISLGFEPGRALGTIDYLEVPEVRLLLPKGPDERFEEAVIAANELLIGEVGPDNLLPYEVTEPDSTFQKLDSLVFGLVNSFRPVIVPLGPKIFSAIAMVLAIRMFPRVCIWRTSSGSGVEVTDKLASGEVAVFDASPLKLPSLG